MDTVTHGLLGVTIGTALLREKAGRAGVAVFTVASLLPDVDGPVYRETLAYVQNHRGPTHSLIGAVVFAVSLAGLAKLLRAPPRFRTLAAISLGGILLHLGFDLLTWWGTQIFWPFSTARVGVGVLFIVDFALAGILLAPMGLWLIAKVRRRPPSPGPFRVATILVGVYLLVVVAARHVALEALETHAAERGTRAVTVFPQPFSPLRWSRIEDEGEGYRMTFVDLLRGLEPVEERTFDKGEGAAATAADESASGRTLLWFYRVPVRTVTRTGSGFEVVYHDLAYEMRPDVGRATPFRYRILLDESMEVAEEGWIRR